MYGRYIEEVRKQNKREERHNDFLERKNRSVREAENLSMQMYISIYFLFFKFCCISSEKSITFTYDSENAETSTADSVESFNEELAGSHHHDVDEERFY